MKKILTAAAAATLLLTACNENPETSARLNEVDTEVAKLQDEITSLKNQLSELNLEPKTSTLGIYQLALTVEGNDSFARYALDGLASTEGGMQVIQNYILSNIIADNATHACDILVDDFKDHPNQEKYLREILAADLSKCPGGHKLRNAKRCIDIAANALFAKNPAEFVDGYLTRTLDEIINSRFDPSNMDEIYSNIKLSFTVSDRAKKRDYAEALIEMYSKAWSSSESKAGYAVLRDLTGQTFGTDDDDSAKVKTTYEEYRKWFDANKANFAEAK